MPQRAGRPCPSGRDAHAPAGGTPALRLVPWPSRPCLPWADACARFTKFFWSLYRLSRRRKESQDLAHHAVSLIRLKEVLRLGRAIEDDQLLGLRRFLILLANPREPRSIRFSVVAGLDEQCDRLEFLGGPVRRRAHEDQSIDLSRSGGDRIPLGIRHSGWACSRSQGSKRSRRNWLLS